MTTLEEVLKPLLCFAKCILVCPFVTNQNSHYYKANKILILTAAITLFLCYINIVCVHFFLWTSSLLIIITHTLLIVQIISITTVWITSFLHHDRFTVILKQLNRIDKSLQHNICNENIKKYIKYGLIVFFVLLAYTSFAYVTFKQFKNITIGLPETYLLVYNLSPLLTYGILIIYIIFIKIIQTRFEFINKSLHKLIGDTNDVMVLKQLRDLRPIHLAICEVGQKINESFGLSVAATISICFHMLLGYSYLIGVTIQCVNGLSLYTNIGFAFLQLLPSMAFIGTLCYHCEGATEEGFKAGKYIHSLQNINEDINNEIRVFSLQILNVDNKFTAGDFWTLNLALIFAIIGGISTYLIILFQFTTTDSGICGFVHETAKALKWI